MNNHFQPVSSRHGKSLNFYKWTSFLFLFLGLISSSVLVYQYYQQRTQRNQLQELKEQTKSQYDLQQNHLVSIGDLVNNPKVHGFFTDLLKNNAEKFAKNKKINISHLPLKFASLYYEPKTGNGYREMGRCWKESKTANIGLNRLYLLNKFGHDKYFNNNPQYGNYSYSDISFNKMIETCSHELAHYIQLAKHDKSSCESDLKLENGNYDEKLAKEHKEFTRDIYGVIKNSDEYSEWEKRWKKI